MSGGSEGCAGGFNGVPPVGPPPVRFSPALAPYAASLAGYDVVPAPAEAHRGLPSTAVVVLLALQEPLQVGWWDARGASASYFAVASGLPDRPAAVGGPQRQRGIWLALTPAGSRALLECRPRRWLARSSTCPPSRRIWASCPSASRRPGAGRSGWGSSSASCWPRSDAA